MVMIALCHVDGAFDAILIATDSVPVATLFRWPRVAATNVVSGIVKD
ncbi:hypothetical protein BWQ96_09717 [Gracilariopsis chorda]|uniref:Uncharacterized protein n=1 Tax=Gracilariopsis chorda TaxID=448386 RepID=A0A2V3IET4_9FLOR|nr:hypothetical protein BWQ96_09717 [Gracilariopsis chorda]|eukprot:PXF40562.1 hypothetical protein BWQ96_09717 [Gracilariopsis chorda]